MQAIVSERYGQVESVELKEVPVPELEDHQVLVRVRASSVNPAEWYRIRGPFFARLPNGLRRPKDRRVGADLAGVVEAVGKDVNDLAAGDEVFGTALGAWAEYAASREPRLVRKPANVSFEEAGSVAIAALTALQGLRDKGQLQPGQKVLINGASGGVGTFAVQIAKWLGGDVTAVCSPRNVEQARELGADRVLDYTREDFTRGGEQYDLILDIAGSRPFRELRRVLKPDGQVVVIGSTMSTKGLGPLGHVIRMKLGSIVRRQKVTFFVARMEKADLETMRDLMESGAVKPVVERTYPLAEAAAALAHLGEGHARGKLVLTVGG
jgi:NADPH:quinone reductase-like Zn-dependent oxidoreductase